MDKHTPEQRHKNMQAVKNKDSEIELLLRRELWSRGIRYQKNSNKVFGHPDMFLSEKRSPCSVTVSFGTVIIGKRKKRKSNLIKIFGFRK